MMLENALSHVKPSLKESVAEWNQLILEEEKIDEDDGMRGPSQEYSKIKELKGELAKLMRPLNVFTGLTLYDLVRKSTMLTYSFEEIIMIYQSDQHLIHYFII